MTTRTTNRRRISPLMIGLALPFLLAGLAFAWWTISPLFINTRVDEAFPVAAAPSSAPLAEPTADAMAADTMADTMAEPTADAMASDTMADTMAEPTAVAEPAAAPAVVAPTAAPAVAEPVALTSGSFTRVDALHSAEGTATIYTLPDGSRVLRLENFSAQNGPDLYVSLSGHPMPRTSAETFDSGYVELERLKANQGNQNYAIPADLDLSTFKSVVIWCKAFSVVFSTAELAPM